MISDYCRKRVAVILSPLETDAVCQYLTILLDHRILPPSLNVDDTWAEISRATGVSADRLKSGHQELAPVLEALTRSISRLNTKKRRKAHAATRCSKTVRSRENDAVSSRVRKSKPRNQLNTADIVEETPTPLWTQWDDPTTLAQALQLHIERHGETRFGVHRSITDQGYAIDYRGFVRWCTGHRVPRSVGSLNILKALERRYRLPAGYFKNKLSHRARASQGHMPGTIPSSERRRLAWHLPDDFNLRTSEEREEILSWVNRVILTGSTEYRAFQAAAIKTRYSVRFRVLQPGRRRLKTAELLVDDANDVDVEMRSSVTTAPAALEDEMRNLLLFKTSTLTAFGLQRNGVWKDATASQKIQHFGLLFGALSASPRTAVRGFGADINSLCFAILAFPAVWDWYLQWRERRRGFFTSWEVDMLSVCLAMVREETGWLRQNPSLVDRLKPIPGLVSEVDIKAAKEDWNGVCDAMHKHGRRRIKEINRVVRVHRDPFEPILPILEAESPVAEYIKITKEVLRLMPDERRHPRAASESVRSFLMLRLGLHLGLRQKNLRQLRVCLHGSVPMSERQLEDLKCGELRWSNKDGGWEVLIPAVAFKNSISSFFGSKPFRLTLPDLGNLYVHIDAYLDRHRKRLLGPAADPGTFFVKTAKKSSSNAAYDLTTFYESWRLAVQRYGIYNPYTGRGAIKGLLPHGPHNVRDVLATHILKKTGSYEQASYAIQDTPDTVAKHYGRFLPQDKSAIAARILNQVWETS
jgi:hypothetical protein